MRRNIFGYLSISLLTPSALLFCLAFLSLSLKLSLPFPFSYIDFLVSFDFLAFFLSLILLIAKNSFFRNPYMDWGFFFCSSWKQSQRSTFFFLGFAQYLILFAFLAALPQLFLSEGVEVHGGIVPYGFLLWLTFGFFGVFCKMVFFPVTIVFFVTLGILVFLMPLSLFGTFELIAGLVFLFLGAKCVPRGTISSKQPFS